MLHSFWGLDLLIGSCLCGCSDGPGAFHGEDNKGNIYDWVVVDGERGTWACFSSNACCDDSGGGAKAQMYYERCC